MLMVSERWAPLSSCSSSFSRRAVLVWMLFSSCSLRCRISESSSLRSHEPEGAGFWGASLGPANNDVDINYRLTARRGDQDATEYGHFSTVGSMNVGFHLLKHLQLQPQRMQKMLRVR